MSDLWPSQRPSTSRPSKYRSSGQKLRTDWFSGWMVTLFTVALIACVAAVLWPVVGNAFDAFSTLTDTLEQATSRNRL